MVKELRFFLLEITALCQREIWRCCYKHLSKKETFRTHKKGKWWHSEILNDTAPIDLRAQCNGTFPNNILQIWKKTAKADNLLLHIKKKMKKNADNLLLQNRLWLNWQLRRTRPFPSAAGFYIFFPPFRRNFFSLHSSSTATRFSLIIQLQWSTQLEIYLLWFGQVIPFASDAGFLDFAHFQFYPSWTLCDVDHSFMLC